MFKTLKNSRTTYTITLVEQFNLTLELSHTEIALNEIHPD